MILTVVFVAGIGLGSLVGVIAVAITTGAGRHK